MKKKFLIISASISLLLACFPFTLCAEEDPESDLGIDAPTQIPALDSYFYDNYVHLPYIESDGSQYINTGIKANQNLIGSISISNLQGTLGEFVGIFGSDKFDARYYLTQDVIRFDYELKNRLQSFYPSEYSIYNIKLGDSKIYMNNELLWTFSNTGDFASTNNIVVFAYYNDSNQIRGMSSFKLYSFSLYDISANDGEGDYIAYYYPARAKSGGTIGLYDAVSKTFITTSTASPFANPTGSDAEMAISSKITNFILSSLGWIGDILDYAISEPVILLFMAIGLAGASIRWARRLVHF